MKKETAIKVINEFSEEFFLKNLFERLIVIDKIESAMKNVMKGKGISHEKIKKEFQK